MARGTAKSDMATTLARATGATRAEALQNMRDAGIANTPNKPKGKAPDEDQQVILDRLDGIRSKSFNELGAAIRQDWGNSEKGIWFGAKPYIGPLASLSSTNDRYMADGAKEIIARFLSNASQWRGPVAKFVKAELNRRLKMPRDPNNAETAQERYDRMMNS